MDKGNFVYITYGCSPFPYEIRTPDGYARGMTSTRFFARRKAKKIASMFGYATKVDHLYLHDYAHPIQPFNKSG